MTATATDPTALAVAPDHPRKLASGPSCHVVRISGARRSRLRTSTGLFCRRRPAVASDAVVARYYDPATAQFLTRDPLEDVTGAPHSYAGDDPLDARDPSGLDCGWTSPWDCGPSLRQASDWAAGFGDTVTFGGTKQIRRLINCEQTGSTSDIGGDQCDDFYHWGNIGGDFANVFDSIVVPGTVGKWIARIPGVTRWAYGSRLFGADSRLFGNSSLGQTSRSGLLNQRASDWRIGWSVNNMSPPAFAEFRLGLPGGGHVPFFAGPIL